MHISFFFLKPNFIANWVIFFLLVIGRLNYKFQEFHLTQNYHDGLLKLQAKEYDKACELLESVLKDPLISNAQVFLFIFLLFFSEG
jgi:hypothetical protein